MKPKRINLNDYEQVKTEKDLEGYSAIIITPLKFADGMQAPDILFRRKAKYKAISDTEGVIWDQNTVITTATTPLKYASLVDWWVESALADEEWKFKINNTFGKNGFDVKMSMDKAIKWLKTCKPSMRKSHLNKFFNIWFNKGFDRYLNAKNYNAGRQ
jgi:hypothetical protein